MENDVKILAQGDSFFKVTDMLKEFRAGMATNGVWELNLESSLGKELRDGMQGISTNGTANVATGWTQAFVDDVAIAWQR